MSREIKAGGSAFPLPMGSETTQGSEGMTLRDYFAAKAMQGFCTQEEQGFGVLKIAASAYEMADAMLKAKGEL